jgi:transaldolase
MLPQPLALPVSTKYKQRARTSINSQGRTGMKIFIDTANIDEIREAHAWGILDGVTTNPSLIAREGGDFIQTIADICEMVQGPVSAETVSQDAAGMIKEGRLLAKISEHVVVKVPLTNAGLTATRALADDGIDVNVTLIFQSAQALMAAKAGAAYVSPFLGRLDDIATDGVQLIDEIVTIFGNYPELGTEVLSASIRHPLHVSQVALAGSDVATIPYKVLSKLVNHPLTVSGNERFLADWATVPDNDIVGQVTAWLEKRGS